MNLYDNANKDNNPELQIQTRWK